jgi:ABC-type multidrug transport system fused ATPase/permease subunit
VVVLLGLMMVGMILETLSVGLIIPVITLMMQGDLSLDFPVITPILNFLGNPSQSVLIIVVMLCLVVIYILKNIFLAFLVWQQTHFAFKVRINLADRLFAIYLRQPYTFHLQRNSAELVRNVHNEVTAFIGVIASAQILVAELMVLVGITTLLLLVEPLGALIVTIVFGGAGCVYHHFTRKHISIWGKERQFHDGLRLQHLQQGLGGAKDVKLLGRESDFLAQYHTHNMKSARASGLQAIFQNYPRLMFELVAVISLSILVISMHLQGENMNSIIPILGLFAAAAFRLMPSITRVLSSIQTLRYNYPVVSVLNKEMSFKTIEVQSLQNMEATIFNQKICLTNLKYQYPDSVLPALDSISIEIFKGETIGIIGASGSGKSTLIDVILGLFNPNSGNVYVDGHDIHLALRQWQDQIGYVPQSIYLTDDTLRRNIAFGLPNELIDDIAVKKAITSAQLDDFVLDLPEGLETIVGERGIRLSGGQRQRIGIARALYHDPHILVLDEATSALDTATEIGVMQAIIALQESKTIIVVAHRLSTVEKCDRLYRLERGKVVEEGTPHKILSSKVYSSLK